MKKFINKDFEDVAYFERDYLKDCVIGAKEKSYRFLFILPTALNLSLKEHPS